MIRDVRVGLSPAVDNLASLDRLYRERPAAMEAFFEWINSTPHGSITLRFSEGRLYVAERTETAK